MFFLLLLGAGPGNTEGFVLYKDEDKTDEVLSYTETDGKIICTVSGINGLPGLPSRSAELHLEKGQERTAYRRA